MEKERKRILIFSTAYLPFIGGAELAVKEITDRLPDFEFVMLTARMKKELPLFEKMGNVSVHRVGRGNSFDKFRLIFSGWKKAKELGSFDLVWSIMASYGGFAALRYKKRNPSVPFLLTLQEGDSKWDIYKHVWFIWPYFKQIFKKADRIQAISNYLAEWARRMGARCEIDVVPNGVDDFRFQISDFRLKSEYKNTFLKKLKLPDNTVFVITVSRLVKKNGVGDLIRAMNFLPSKVHLIVAGTGELEQEFKKFSTDARLSDRVHFIGNVSPGDVPPYLLASDVFCRPSLSEGLGNAFLEAMAAGLPVVGTSVGGIPDFLKDPSDASGQAPTGWFCRVKDPKDIAEKIKYVTDEKNKDEVLRVVENARNMVEENYTWDTIARRMKSIFESV